MNCCCPRIPPEPRNREDYNSLTNWLLPKHRQDENKINLPKSPNPQVFCPFISSEMFALSEQDMPKDIFPFSIIPDPVTIPGVQQNDVWKVLMDFNNYENWNPFQKRVRILNPYDYENGKKSNAIFEMTTDLFGIVREQILYVDEERMIFIYGYVSQGTNPEVEAIRAQWLTEDKDGHVVYHSMTSFKGGLAFWSVRLLPFLRRSILKQFNLSHEALKEYIMKSHSE